MNDAQRALLERLREIIEETPKSGAVNAAKRPLHITRFAQAVERRADDGEALVKYARSKVREKPSSSYGALVAAGRADLTVEALVADADAEWAPEFSDADRIAAQRRLGSMVEEHRKTVEAEATNAAAHDRRIVAQVSESRVAKGRPALTADQEATMLEGLATKKRSNTR